MSLGEFVTYFVLLLHKNGIPLQIRNSKLWHQFFYKLQLTPVSKGRPVLLFELLRFDWDGPYPKSKELMEVLDALCWAGCLQTSSPSLGEYVLSEPMAEVWSRRYEGINEEFKIFFETALRMAKKDFAKQDSHVALK